MKNSKLASLLSKLSQKEFKEFGKFVKSPYFNSNSNIVKLYELISKCFPDFENPKLTKENIYSTIYPGEKYNDSTARGLLSAALKLAEEFLTVNHLRNERYKSMEFLLSELSERKIFDLFNIHLKSIRHELENVPSLDAEHYFMRYRIETMISSIESKAYIPLTQKDIPGDTHTKDSDNLVNFFLITVLRRYIYLLTKTGSLNVNLDLKFFDEIISYLERTDLEKMPILNFQYNRIMLYRSNWEEKYYLALKNIFYRQFNTLGPEERYNIFATLQNYCVMRNRIFNDNLDKEQYELYKFAIDKNILTFDETEFIHPMLYSNIVSTFITMKNIGEAREFIENNKDRLDPERKDTAVNFNLAKIYFAEGKYDDALTSISYAHQEDVFYKVAIKGLYAQIYYEKEFTEELISHIEAYKSFLNSNEVINKSLKDNHVNFVNFLSRLVKHGDVKNKSELEFLKHEIENTSTILAKDWLIMKIDQLLK